MNCPICETEIDAITPEVKLAMNEDKWMNHCEAMLQQGGRPRKFENIPEYLKTERIKKYYLNLEKRISLRLRSGNEDRLVSVAEPSTKEKKSNGNQKHDNE